MFRGLFRHCRPGRLTPDKGEGMFRNQRSRWTAVLVIVALLVALPAAAGERREARVSEPSWWAQALAWLSTTWNGHKASSTRSSSYIDPLGQPNTAAGLAGSDSSSGIDPLGQH